MPDIGKGRLSENCFGMVFKVLRMSKKICSHARASLTIEAAVTLPIFIFFSIAVTYLLIIISLQSNIQQSMEDAARKLGKQAYLTNETDLGVLINAVTARAYILNGDLKDEIDNSQILNGSGGVSTLLTEYDEENGILDIVVTYTYEIPFLPENIGKLRFLQRSRSRVWIGEEISADTEKADEDTIVYITPTGSVYHTTKSCTYLDLSVRNIDIEDLYDARNKNGSMYKECTDCVKGDSYTTVYITDYGTYYHMTLSCSALKRTVIAVNLSEVEGRAACSKCGGSE